MKDVPKYHVGDVVQIINGGHTYPLWKNKFEELHFKNTLNNRWCWDTYTDRNELYIIHGISFDDNNNELYKVICTTDENIEYLISSLGIKLISHGTKKVKIL